MRLQDRCKQVGISNLSNAGFSLVELLIVVSVILIIAAIAIPNYIQSKMRANEASAVHTLRDISTAELFYSSTYGINYSTSLIQLSGDGVNPDPNHAGLIDDLVASGVKQGYTVIYTPTATDTHGHTITYTLTADPTSQGVSGQRHFYTDHTCVIRSNNSAQASPTDLPL